MHKIVHVFIDNQLIRLFLLCMDCAWIVRGLCIDCARIVQMQCVDRVFDPSQPPQRGGDVM